MLTMPETKDQRNAQIRKEIMDLRDHRVRIQRKIVYLEDKQLFEPNNFSPDDSCWLKYHRADVARIKAKEAQLRTLIR